MLEVVDNLMCMCLSPQGLWEVEKHVAAINQSHNYTAGIKLVFPPPTQMSVKLKISDAALSKSTVVFIGSLVIIVGLIHSLNMQKMTFGHSF